jgi:hypothetical protein
VIHDHLWVVAAQLRLLHSTTTPTFRLTIALSLVWQDRHFCVR